MKPLTLSEIKFALENNFLLPEHYEDSNIEYYKTGIEDRLPTHIYRLYYPIFVTPYDLKRKQPYLMKLKEYKNNEQSDNIFSTYNVIPSFLKKTNYIYTDTETNNELLKEWSDIFQKLFELGSEWNIQIDMKEKLTFALIKQSAKLRANLIFEKIDIKNFNLFNENFWTLAEKGRTFYDYTYEHSKHYNSYSMFNLFEKNDTFVELLSTKFENHEDLDRFGDYLISHVDRYDRFPTLEYKVWLKAFDRLTPLNSLDKFNNIQNYMLNKIKKSSAKITEITACLKLLEYTNISNTKNIYFYYFNKSKNKTLINFSYNILKKHNLISEIKDTSLFLNESTNTIYRHDININTKYLKSIFNNDIFLVINLLEFIENHYNDYNTDCYIKLEANQNDEKATFRIESLIPNKTMEAKNDISRYIKLIFQDKILEQAFIKIISKRAGIHKIDYIKNNNENTDYFHSQIKSYLLNDKLNDNLPINSKKIKSFKI